MSVFEPASMMVKCDPRHGKLGRILVAFSDLNFLVFCSLSDVEVGNLTFRRGSEVSQGNTWPVA